jgi:hypothetical protein
VAELAQRCRQLQPRIADACLRELDGPSRQALSALDTKKGGELLLLQETEVTSDTSSPAKPKRASRYRNASGKTQSHDFCETPDMLDRNNASAGSVDSFWDAPVGPQGVRRLRHSRDSNSERERPPLPPLRDTTGNLLDSRASSRDEREALSRVNSSEINPLDMSVDSSGSRMPRRRREAKSSLGLRPEPASLQVDGLDVLIDSLDSKERKSKTR